MGYQFPPEWWGLINESIGIKWGDMMKPTDEQHNILRGNGWKFQPGRFYKCRVCHQAINFNYGYFSPNYAAYHQLCVMDAPQVKKLFKKIEAQP